MEGGHILPGHSRHLMGMAILVEAPLCRAPPTPTIPRMTDPGRVHAMIPLTLLAVITGEWLQRFQCALR